MSHLQMMRNRRPPMGLVLALALAVLAALVWPQSTWAAEGTPEAPVVLIQFAPDTSSEARAAQIAQLGGELVNWLPQIHVAEVQLHSQAAMAAASLAQGSITFIEPDMPVTGAYLPSDPDFADQAKSYGLSQVQAPAAWDLTTGSHEVLIAVVDSGIKLDHPEFNGRLDVGYDFVDDDAQPQDESGHGTHIAGTIAASMDDGQGVSGLCPRCRVLPVRVLDAANQGTWANLARGILYAVDHGADIVNLSLGAPSRSQTLEAAVAYAVARGVLVVAAAGNLGSDLPFYPAALDGVIGVGATTAQGDRWPLSNYGSHVDVTAPGDLVYSTYHVADNVFQGHTYMSGTSMATPFVSGSAGLVWSLYPELSAAEVTAALTNGADDLGPAGWDPEFGYGRINAYRTLYSPLGSFSTADGSAPGTGTNRIFLPAIAGQ